MPGPIDTVAKRSAMRCSSSSCTRSSTSTRDPAEQVCPAFCRMAFAITVAARSTSASPNTRWADLPPSSSVTGATRLAAAPAIRRPTSVEPTKLRWSMPGWAASAAPASGPSPVTTLITPAGKPASAASRAR